MTRIFALAVAAIAIALVAGMWMAGRFSSTNDPFADCRSAQVVGGVGQIGGPFTLINSKGETVTDKDVLTRPSLIYFGYTFCPDVCPVDNARNAEAVDILEQNGKMVTPIFISIDPARDTPEVVGEYAANLHDRMIGLTGTPEQVKAVSQAYKTYFNAHVNGDDNYEVDHSTFTYLTLPGRGVVDFFRRDASAPQMADKVACFIDKS